MDEMLKKFKEDKVKALSDLQTLARNQIMMQGVVAYLDKSIADLEKETKEDK